MALKHYVVLEDNVLREVSAEDYDRIVAERALQQRALNEQREQENTDEQE